MAKAKKIFWQVVLIVVLVAAVSFSYFWYAGKQRRVETGAARPTFPYSDYSLEELEKLYPQYPTENVLTTQTPKETYSKFRDYLKEQNIEEASKLFYSRNKESYTNALKEMKSEGGLIELYEKLPVQLEEISCYDTICTFKADSDSFIRFIKDLQGIWLIESL